MSASLKSAYPRAGSTGGSSRTGSGKLGASLPQHSGATVLHTPGSAPTLSIPGRASAGSVASDVSTAPMVSESTKFEMPYKESSEDKSTSKPMSSIGPVGRLFPLSEQPGQDSHPPCFISEAQLKKEVRDQLAKQEESIQTRMNEALENLKSEYNASLAEIRRDMGVHQSIQAELTDVRRSLSMKQDRLSEDAARGLQPPDAQAGAAGADHQALQQLRGDLEAYRMEQQSKFAALHEFFERQRQSISHSEAAISDLRSDVQSQRDAQIAQAEDSRVAMQDLQRNCSEMQQEALQALQELEKRCSADMNRCALEFSNLLDATKASLKAEQQEGLQRLHDKYGVENSNSDMKTVELSQAIEKLKGDANAERSQADLKIISKLQETEMKLSRCEAVGKDLQQRLEEGQRHLDQVKRVEESWTSMQGEHSARIDALQRIIEQDHLERNKNTAVVTTRLEAIENSVASVPASQPSSLSSAQLDQSVTQISSRIDAVEASCRDVALVAAAQKQQERSSIDKADMAGILARLDILEHQGASAVSAGKAADTHTNEELVNLSARLDLLEVSCRDAVQLAVQRVESALGMGAPQPGQKGGLADRLLTLEKRFGDFVKAQNTMDYPSSLPRNSEGPRGSDVSTSTGRGSDAMMPVAAAERAASRRAALSMKVEAMLPEGNLSPNVKDVATAASELRSFIATGLAQCIGEMDAELWVEMARQIQTLGSELRSELMSELDKKTGDSRAQTTTMNTMGVEVKRLVGDVSNRVAKMEQAISEVLGCRMVQTEGEVKKLSLLVAALMDRSEKVNASDLMAQAEELTTMALGNMTASTATAGPISESSMSHKPPLSDDVESIRDVSMAGSVYGGSDSLTLHEADSHANNPTGGADGDTWLGKLQRMLTEGKSKPAQSSTRPDSASDAIAAALGSARIPLSQGPPRSSSTEAMGARGSPFAGQPASRPSYVSSALSGSALSDFERDQASRSDTDPNQPQTAGQAKLSAGLKESLQDLVSAVHRTLAAPEGADSGGSFTAPVVNSRSFSPTRGQSESRMLGQAETMNSTFPLSRETRPLLEGHPSMRRPTAGPIRDTSPGAGPEPMPGMSPSVAKRNISRGDPRLEVTDSVIGRATSTGGSRDPALASLAVPSGADASRDSSVNRQGGALRGPYTSGVRLSGGPAPIQDRSASRKFSPMPTAHRGTTGGLLTRDATSLGKEPGAARMPSTQDRTLNPVAGTRSGMASPTPSVRTQAQGPSPRWG